MRVRTPASTKYIETSGAISLATTVSANYTLLLSSDSPNSALVSDFGSDVAQVENNSKILKGSFIQTNLIAATVPCTVNLWVWLNSKGMTTSPTNGFDFSESPNTVNNQQLREKTIAYRRVSVSPNEFRSFRIRLAGRRNNFLPDPTSQLVMTIHNSGAGTISHSSFGRIRVLEG